MIKKYAVIGNPISQSRSPEIHKLFAAQLGHEIEYTKIKADPENFVATVENFAASGGLGLNVTAPFKLAAAKFVDSLSARAKFAQAVNTIIFKSNKVFGDNTDGLGLVKDIELNLQQPITDKKILLIGAGGAARGVLLPLVEAKPKSVLIVNRTEQTAKNLAQLINGNEIITAGGLDASKGKGFDIVINATSAGLSNASLPEVNYYFEANSLAYDLVYSNAATRFMVQAKQAGAHHTSDGLGMLVEQAAFSYKLWHGEMPDTQSVLKQIR